MITLVCGLVAAILFLFDFLGAKWAGHDLTSLALVFLAVAIAFIGVVPWPWVRRGPQ